MHRSSPSPSRGLIDFRSAHSKSPVGGVSPRLDPLPASLPLPPLSKRSDSPAFGRRSFRARLPSLQPLVDRDFDPFAPTSSFGFESSLAPRSLAGSTGCTSPPSPFMVLAGCPSVSLASLTPTAVTAVSTAPRPRNNPFQSPPASSCRALDPAFAPFEFSLWSSARPSPSPRQEATSNTQTLRLPISPTGPLRQPRTLVDRLSSPPHVHGSVSPTSVENEPLLDTAAGHRAGGPELEPAVVSKRRARAALKSPAGSVQTSPGPTAVSPAFDGGLRPHRPPGASPSIRKGTLPTSGLASSAALSSLDASLPAQQPSDPAGTLDSNRSPQQLAGPADVPTPACTAATSVGLTVLCNLESSEDARSGGRDGSFRSALQRVSPSSVHRSSPLAGRRQTSLINTALEYKIGLRSPSAKTGSPLAKKQSAGGGAWSTDASLDDAPVEPATPSGLCVSIFVPDQPVGSQSPVAAAGASVGISELSVITTPFCSEDAPCDGIGWGAPSSQVGSVPIGHGHDDGTLAAAATTDADSDGGNIPVSDWKRGKLLGVGSFGKVFKGLVIASGTCAPHVFERPTVSAHSCVLAPPAT
jgi:hypothetical protein